MRVILVIFVGIAVVSMGYYAYRAHQKSLVPKLMYSTADVQSSLNHFDYGRMGCLTGNQIDAVAITLMGRGPSKGCFLFATKGLAVTKLVPDGVGGTIEYAFDASGAALFRIYECEDKYRSIVIQP